MKAKWFVLIISQIFFLGVFLIGAPITFKLQEISLIGSRYQIITPHNTLARIIGLSSKAELTCEDMESRCVNPIDRHHFNAHLPIIFENCSQNTDEIGCERPQVLFTTNTRVLIFGGFSK